MKKTVLMVDDARPYCMQTHERVSGLDPEITFLMAHSIWEAEEVFEKHRNTLDLIVMDGKLDGTVEETCELVKKMRQSGFNGPMIAASSMYNHLLISAGCSINSGLTNLAKEIVEILAKEAG